jgi:hypothetical protein
MATNNSMRKMASSALVLALLGIGATASAQQTVVVEGDGDDDSRGPNAFLFNSGLITTGLSYTPALIVAVNSDRSEDKYLYAPFVGPWLDLAARDGGSKLQNTLLVVDGVFQAIGAIQIIASFTYMDGGDGATTTADASSSFISQAAVTPAMLSEDGYGVVAVGRF